MQLLNFIIPQSCNLSIFQSCNLIFFQSYNLSSINNTLLLRQTRTQINRLINVVFFTFLFSLFSFSYGQVKIKEKVEIKPGSNIGKFIGFAQTTASSEYFPCGPYITNTDYNNPNQVVWIYSEYPLDVEQQAFNVQDTNVYYMVDGIYNVEVISGNDKCVFRELKTDSSNVNEVFRYREDVGTVLDSISAVTEMQNDTSGYFFVQGVMTQYDVKYNVKFLHEGDVTIKYTRTDLGDSDLNKIIYFHTKVVKPDYIMDDASSNIMPHGEEMELQISSKPLQCSAAWADTLYADPPVVPIVGIWNGAYYNGNYTYEIIEGEEYGTLVYQRFDDNQAVYVRENHPYFDNIEDGEMFYWARGALPNDTNIVKIRVTETKENLMYEKTIKIIKNDYYPIKITFIPDGLKSGDTLDVVLEKEIDPEISSDDNYEAFPSEQLFDVEMIKGSDYAAVYSPTDNYSSNEFIGIPQGFKVVVSAVEIPDTAEIILRVSTIIQTGNAAEQSGSEMSVNYSKKNRVENSLNKSSGNINSITTFEPPIIDGKKIIGIGKVGKKPISILLGETKYFGVKKKGNKYKIAVTDTTFGVKPSWATLSDGWEWVKDSTVWGTDPIEKLGSKSGVYWEKKWYDKTNNTNNDLPAGMIRLIGRYWEEEKEDSFKVKLKTTAAYNNAEVLVKVIEPKKLGNKHSKAKDVFDKVVNIDSLCIYYGGKNGIPPQFLKGHIAQESYTKDFGAQVGEGFAPGYRFEPYVTQKQFKIFNGEFSNNPFYITATTTVNPPNHQHVKIIPYFSGDTITVWQIVKEHSQLVEDGNTDPTKMYGVRKHDQTMNYGFYTAIQNTYNEFFDKTEKFTKKDINGKDRKLTFAERADTTNKMMIKYLRDEFPFKDKNNTKGMKNMIAQTRILSSYGYFQAMYTTAILKAWSYPEDAEHLPENLNEFDVQFPMVVNRYNGYLSDLETSAWEKGFEITIRDYVYERWNKHDKYPDQTLNNVEKYLPKK